eukprot:TRINITY_DN33388_c0_g1_i1.p2 TRINITY_DN33388_c0_g1~~TRINITY_DN33388_c0_g1_i1.p2  ORF type:complete len:210 (+),score=30.19 TRINITY_DN33388_c0_g1_i1:135-764(+)
MSFYSHKTSYPTKLAFQQNKLIFRKVVGNNGNFLRAGRLQRKIKCQSGASSASGKDKEGAARKALEEAFKGKRDVLASNDPKLSRFSGGGSGDGKGGGSGGGWFGSFNWNEFGDGAKKSFGGFFRTIGAILLFAFAFGVVAMIKPTIGFISSVLRNVLRLDGRPQRLQYSNMSQSELFSEEGELGTFEKSVIEKYGAESEDVEYEESKS